jgi:hypothetical protein
LMSPSYPTPVVLLKRAVIILKVEVTAHSLAHAGFEFA